MCGIAGVHGFSDEGTLGEMLSRIHHRGPDDQGEYYEPDEPLMMGARRLSIIDLERGSQPMRNEDGSVVVVFNGEIYNHLELRLELEAAGHTFETESDTEVLVHLWEEYGTEMPEHLDGMFAFSLWDRTDRILFLARDRLGIKPLYYADEPGSFVWGSELPSVLATDVDRSLNERAVERYFSLRYTPWPETLLSSVRKVPPGCSLTVTNGNVECVTQYWTLTNRSTPGSRDDCVREIRRRLEASVRKRLMSDVPLGAFLSGGLDSSAIAALANGMIEDPLKTFAVAFRNDEYDESNEARFVAESLGTDHHETVVDLESMDVFGDVVRRFGEPLADPASLPTLILSEYANEHVKVVMTGEGADELFAGYDYFRMLVKHRNLFGRLPPSTYEVAERASELTPLGEKYLRYFGALQSDRDTLLNWLRGYGTLPETYLQGDRELGDRHLRKFAREAEVNGNDTLQRLSWYFIRYWLSDDLLYKVDHASMAASIEARVPFLDHSLVELSFSIPSEYKLRGGNYKPLLGSAVEDVVPGRTRRRSKHGFNVPVARWFRNDHEAITRWLNEEKVDETPYLDADSVFELWSDHRAGTAANDDALWRILNYVAWYHEHVKR